MFNAPHILLCPLPDVSGHSYAWFGVHEYTLDVQLHMVPSHTPGSRTKATIFWRGEAEGSNTEGGGEMLEEGEIAVADVKHNDKR